MSRWIRVTFDSGERSTESVARNLHSSIDEPETFKQDGRLVWKAREEVTADRLNELAIAAPRVIVMEVNDTTNSGRGRFYERIDEEYVLVDSMSGDEQYLGRDVIRYFQRYHGLVGVKQ